MTDIRLVYPSNMAKLIAVNKDSYRKDIVEIGKGNIGVYDTAIIAVEVMMQIL